MPLEMPSTFLWRNTRDVRSDRDKSSKLGCFEMVAVPHNLDVSAYVNMQIISPYIISG